jgi:hypothetical protein
LSDQTTLRQVSEKGSLSFSRCENCTHWLIKRQTNYSSGEVIVNFEALAGHGHCTFFDRPEPADFGCVRFEVAASPLDHVEVAHKEGEPWRNFRMIPCPDCHPNGGAGGRGHRCAGTGLVRLYDDGYVGDEQTRKHPKEIEWEKEHPQPQQDTSGFKLAPTPEKTDPQNDPFPVPESARL